MLDLWDDVERHGTRFIFPSIPNRSPMTDEEIALRHEPKGCRWINGDVKVGPWWFCQKPQKAESSYCKEHHGVCYTGVPDDKPLGRIPR